MNQLCLAQVSFSYTGVFSKLPMHLHEPEEFNMKRMLDPVEVWQLDEF